MIPPDQLAVQSWRVVVRSVPEAGESLYGWALRLAEANGYRGAKSIFSLLKAVPASVVRKQDRLAQLVGGSPDDFKAYTTEQNAALYYGGELGLGWQYFSAKQPKACPACLAEEGILKSVWNLKIWRYCPEHSCKLISVCPFCSKPLVRGQRAVYRCGNPSCSEDLGRAIRIEIPKHIESIVYMLGDVASGRRGATIADLPDQLAAISLQGLVHLTEILSKPFLGDRRDLSEEDCVCDSLGIVASALKAWPRGYHLYLDQLRSVRHTASCYSRDDYGFLNREFPFLWHSLKYGRSGISEQVIDLLKRELAAYVEEHIPSALNARALLTGEASRFTRLTTAVRELGLSSDRVIRARREGLIKTTTMRLRRGTKHFVDRDQLIRHIPNLDRQSTRFAFKARHSLLSVADSSDVLKIGKANVKCLMRAGHLKTMTHSGTTWCTVVSIVGLIGSLLKIAGHRSDESLKGIELPRCSAVSAATIADVIEGALRGALRLTRNGSGRGGLRDFLVDREKLLKLFPVVPLGYISTREAAQHPDIGKPFLAAAIRCGLLPSVEHPIKGGMISRSALARFRAKYVGARELQHILGNDRSAWPKLEEGEARVPCSRGFGAYIWYRKRALRILGMSLQ